MHRKITASLISKWHGVQLDGNPTLEQCDDLRYDFGTALPFFINPQVYENFPFSSLGEPEIKLTNLSPLPGEAWVSFCYQKINGSSNSPLRADGFMLPFEWREKTEHSSLIPESFHRLADQILSSSFLFSSPSLNSQCQSNEWGLHPSFQRFGDTIDFSDAGLFSENIGSAWGALAVGLFAARNRYVPAPWPFCSLQFNYMTGCPVSVEGIDCKLSVAASYGCHDFVIAPGQFIEANHALNELIKREIPGCESIRIVASQTQPETIINSILFSNIDWLRDTIREEIKKDKELDKTDTDKKSKNKLFKPETLTAGLTGGAIVLTADAILSEVVAGEKNSHDDVRIPGSDGSINSVDDVHSHKPGTIDMTTDYDAPKKWGIDSSDTVGPEIQQEHPDTCAIRSQELILRDFGINVSEDDLVNKATENGWYHSGSGTPMNDVGNLLEQYGLSVNRFENANIFTLCSELAQNHKVIIGVDSGELWHKGAWEKVQDFVGFQKADHALLVSGIDTSDPDHIKVVLTDPGTGDVAKEYPADQFMDAWKDSGYYMVATKDSAPAHLPESAHFDYAAGHLPSFGGWEFSELNDAAMQSSYSKVFEDVSKQSEFVDQLFQHHSSYENNLHPLINNSVLDELNIFPDHILLASHGDNSGQDSDLYHTDTMDSANDHLW